MLSNTHCDLKTPQHCNHSDANIPVYNTYDTIGLTAACSHCCQSSVHTIYQVIGPLIHFHSCLDWAKSQLKQHGQAYLISTTDKWLSCRTMASSLLNLYICSSHNALSYSCIAGIIAASVRHKPFITGCKLHSILPNHTVPAWKASATTGKFLLAIGNLIQHRVPDFNE